MSGAAQNDPFASVSSSSQSPPNAQTHTPPSTADRDELDYLGEDSDNDIAGHGQGHVLDDDPFREDLNTPLSFKRKPKPSVLSGTSRFFSALTGSPSAPRQETPSPHRRLRPRDSSISVATGSPHRSQSVNVNAASKDGVSHDWYTEGPGRRVGYEDMTAIDWIFEYTKERQRLRVLSSSASGILGYFQHFLDASQVWIILVLTGLLVGAIAAGIDVTSDWLGDLKLGFCSSGPEGGHFYLNKSFCCYGYDQGSKCAGWKYWSEALGVHAAGGRWFIEYFFYLLFSVSFSPFPPNRFASLTNRMTGNTSILRRASCTRVCNLCQA